MRKEFVVRRYNLQKKSYRSKCWKDNEYFFFKFYLISFKYSKEKTFHRMQKFAELWIAYLLSHERSYSAFQIVSLVSLSFWTVYYFYSFVKWIFGRLNWFFSNFLDDKLFCRNTFKEIKFWFRFYKEFIYVLQQFKILRSIGIHIIINELNPSTLHPFLTPRSYKLATKQL